MFKVKLFTKGKDGNEKQYTKTIKKDGKVFKPDEDGFYSTVIFKS